MAESPLPVHEFDAQKLKLRLDVTIPAEISRIAPLVQRVLEVIGGMGCGAGKEFEIETALQEALANAVVHGCGQDPDHQVRVCVACDEARGMLIIVRDPGGGFDPAQIPSPIVGENVYSDSGRGIFLINRLMDEVEFKRGGAEIWMRMR